MPDAIFVDPRLTQFYDAFEDSRSDLTHYLHIARELHATTVVDIGCGTGAFALLAANEGLHVTGVDPAAASLDVARAKPGADHIVWHLGDATTLPAVRADLAVMTGNVAQVFLSDDSWNATLAAVHTSLVPGGHLVYETRQLSDRAWERWARDTTATVDLSTVSATSPNAQSSKTSNCHSSHSGTNTTSPAASGSSPPPRCASEATRRTEPHSITQDSP